MITRETNKCDIIYLNVGSLLSNLLSVRLLFEDKKPLIMLCSETCLTENIKDFEINVENYRLERCDSHSRHTGGVVVYIRQCIDYKVILNTCFLKSIWCIVFEINNCALKGLYIVFYRSPSSSVPYF